MPENSEVAWCWDQLKAIADCLKEANLELLKIDAEFLKDDNGKM